MQMSRLFEIIYLLLNKDRMTARELAERFEVSTRTIYRDIDTISLAGIPIYTEKGKNGGISLLPDFVLNKSVLSEKEQDEILSALQGLAQIQSADSDNILRKLSTIFNKTATKWLEVDFSEWGYEGGDMWGELKSAIVERRIIEFDYFSSYSEKTHRRVEPVQLWFKSKSWYLKAFDLVKQDIRLFKLTRIAGLETTDETFAERDLLATLPKDDPAASKTPDITLRLQIKSEMAYRVLDEFAAYVDGQEEDGSYLVSICLPEDNWVYGIVLSFAEFIEVLEPPHVRDKIREKAKKIFELYS